MLADDERRGDVTVALARGDEAQNLELSLRESVSRAASRRDAREIGLGSEAIEDLWSERYTSVAGGGGLRAAAQFLYYRVRPILPRRLRVAGS